MLTRNHFIAAAIAAGVASQLGSAPAYGATHIQDAPSMSRARTAVVSQDHAYLTDRQILDQLLRASHRDKTPVLIPKNLAAKVWGEITQPGWATAEIARNGRKESEIVAVYDNDEPQVGMVTKIDAALSKAFYGGQEPQTAAERVDSAIKASERIIYSVDAVKEMGHVTKQSLSALITQKMVGQEMLENFRLGPVNAQTFSKQVTAERGR